MKEMHIEIIKAMCDCNMNIQMVSKVIHKCRGTIEYHIGKIKEEYGLDPRCFHDLIELKKIADRESGSDDKEKALNAYNQMKEYCSLRPGCEGCQFEMDEPYEGMCLLVDEGAPRHWPELEIEKVSGKA